MIVLQIDIGIFLSDIITHFNSIKMSFASTAPNFMPEWIEENSFNNNERIPSSFRMIIIGSSNSGKTFLTLKLLLTPKMLDYDNLIIFSKSVNQSSIQLLYHGFLNGLHKEDIINIFKYQNEIKKEYQTNDVSLICERFAQELHLEATPGWTPNNTTITLSDKFEDIPLPESLDKTKKNLIIFDDCVTCRNQEVMSSYFTKSRHNNCNCIYLSQSFYDLPKRTIRNNCNFYILFKLTKRDQENIYHDLFSKIMEKNEFDLLVNNHWKTKYNYLCLNLDDENISKSLL